MTRLFIGLMSGTSLDGVDGVLAHWTPEPQPTWLAHAFVPFPTALRQTFLELHQARAHELEQAQLAGLDLARLYAQVTQELLETRQLKPADIRAIGAHGQTIRHRPVINGGVGYSLQVHQAAYLAELTGISVVADFRSRDIAAGGQGAPLVPIYHAALVHDLPRPVAVVNVGGVANVTGKRSYQPRHDMLDAAVVMDEIFASLLQDIAVLQSLSIQIALVFGARQQIQELAAARG